MQKEKAYPILCDISGIADSDKARDYLATRLSANESRKHSGTSKRYPL
jgi:hypothetical protein